MNSIEIVEGEPIVLEIGTVFVSDIGEELVVEKITADTIYMRGEPWPDGDLGTLSCHDRNTIERMIVDHNASL